MADSDRDTESGLAAGGFSSWLVEIQGAIRGERGAVVPCGGCTACCTSSQFVHVEPDETKTLSRIAPELLFPAPRRPPGHMLLGYDERGHCPMLIDNQCSIYEDRPRSCRSYDCRIFPAAGVAVDDDKPLIAQRVQRWRFSFPTRADREQFEAVQAAAKSLDDRPGLSPDGVAPVNATGRALRAIELHEAFLPRHEAETRTNQAT
jgi:Fe-S-cluster containining protein